MNHSFKGLFVLACLFLQTGLAQASICRPDIGINLEGISYYTRGMPFNDLAKLSPGWFRPWESSYEDVPLDLDENGYLKTVDPGFAQTLIHDDAWGRFEDDDVYVLLYEGEGKLEFNLADVKVLDRSPGRIEFRIIESGRLGLKQLSTNADNYLRNIRIIPKRLEHDYAGNEIRDSFFEPWLGVSVIRYLNQLEINDSKQKTWQDRKKSSHFKYGGRSIEDAVRIANQTHTDPWIMAPHGADDDYFRNLAIYVKKHLRPDLKVYIEYTNEFWNWGFEAAHFLEELAEKNKSELHLEYVKRSLALFEIWEDVFGGTERLVRVIGTQFSNSWLTGLILKAPGAGSKADALAVGYYFGGEVGEPEMAPETLRMSLDEIFEHLEQRSLPQAKSWLREQKELADKYGLKLIAYEAGQHLVGTGDHKKLGELVHHDELTKKLVQVNRDPRMKNMYDRHYQNWLEVGGGLLVWYRATGGASKWGSWGILEKTHFDPAKAPKYQAVREHLDMDVCRD